MNVLASMARAGPFGVHMFFPKRDKPSEAMALLGNVGTIGLQLVVATFIGLAMGYFLDEWLGTKPWLLIAFLLLGIVAGFRDVYREAMRLQRGGEPGPGHGKGGPGAGKEG